MKGVPIEICRLILDFLSYKEYRTLRLVSRLWNELCERLVWKRVLVGDNILDVRYPFDRTFGSFGVEDDKSGTIVLNNQQIWELASDERVLRVASYTYELEIGHYTFYYAAGEEVSTEGVFDVIGRMFSRVKRVKTWLDHGNHGASPPLAFQRVLDMWKPTVEFSLVVMPISRETRRGIFHVDGAKIKELIFWHTGLRGEEAFLPLSRTKDGAAIPLGDLPTLCSTLATLSIGIQRAALGWQLRVPDATRVLHIVDQVALAMDFHPLGRLVIPSGLEELHIEENQSAVARSLFDYLDLSGASELRVLSYSRGGGHLSSALSRAVLEVKDSLKCLAITCRRGNTHSAEWSFNLGDLARGNLGLKHLVVPVEAIRTRNEYKLEGGFPELESLWIDLAVDGQCSVPAGGDLLDGLVTEILSGCPKLSRSGVKTFKSLDRNAALDSFRLSLDSDSFRSFLSGN